jgi:hypothetical protein
MTTFLLLFRFRVPLADRIARYQRVSSHLSFLKNDKKNNYALFVDPNGIEPLTSRMQIWRSPS